MFGDYCCQLSDWRYVIGQLDWKVGVENDNNDQTLIKEQWIRSLAEVVIEGLFQDIWDIYFLTSS